MKDRACYQMIISLIEAGKLKKGNTIIEPTSGNTGIGLACLCNYFSLNCIIVMPESMSLERRKLIKDYHAKLELVSGGMKECKERAEELRQQIPNSVILGQFDNENNVKENFIIRKKEICILFRNYYLFIIYYDCILCSVCMLNHIFLISVVFLIKTKIHLKI